MQATAQHVSDVGVALEESQRVLVVGVDQGPIEVEQLVSRAPARTTLATRSAGGSTLGEFAAKIVQRHRVAPGAVGEARFDR